MANIAEKVSFIFNEANDDKNVIDILNISNKDILVPFVESPLSNSKRVEFRTDCQLFTEEAMLWSKVNDTTLIINQFKFCSSFGTDTIIMQDQISQGVVLVPERFPQ